MDFKLLAEKLTQKQLKKYYIKKLETVGRFDVWEMNGKGLRRDEDIQFTNYAHHYLIHDIPTYEFWIDRHSHPEENYFYIEHMMKEWALMHGGMKREKAQEIADRYEEKIRRNAHVDGVVKGKKDGYQPQKNLWKVVDGIKVFIVNEEEVRTHLDVHYAEGGHDVVYKYIPKGEIWIGDDLLRSERKFILTHEMFERKLMLKGMSYVPAHRRATIKEHEERWQEAA
jgi:hypothetical protein